MKISVGQILQERFEIRANLGEGGFATVYRAQDKQLGREVALKILKSSPSDCVGVRFQREAMLLGKLSHNHIVSVYSYGLLDDEATPYIAMELLKGTSLQRRLNEVGRISSELLCTILSQSCQALAYAHSAGVVHRDLSPVNIFILEQERQSEIQIKILDFGLSTVFSSDRETKESGSLTETGTVLGNPNYMSPELASGMKADLRSDIYSLGCVLYHCLVGEAPFHADSPVGLIYQQLHSYPPKPKTIDPGSERDELLSSIALRCIQKDPAKRFQSCEEILYCLDKGMMENGLPINKDSLLWSDQSSARSNSSSWPKLVACLAILLGILLIISQLELTLLLGASIFIALDSIQLSGLEQQYARYLIDSSKLQLAEECYTHLVNLYTSHDNKHQTATCLLKLSDSQSRSNNSNAIDSMKRFVQITSDLPDNEELSELLSSALTLLQTTQTKALLNDDKQQLVNAVFLQMLKAAEPNKAELRRCFNVLFKKHVAPFNPDLESITVTRYLEVAKPALTASEVGRLDSLASKCSSARAESIWRARLKLAGDSEDKIFRVRYGLAECIAARKPQEALSLLQAARHDHADIYDYTSTWSKEADVEHTQLHDYSKALYCCDRGLEILSGAPLVAYHRSRDRKIHMSLMKIHLLFDFGKYEEMRQFSKKVLKELLNDIPDESERFDNTNGLEKTISHSVKAAGKNDDELMRIYERDGFFPFLECMLATKQYDQAKLLLSFLQKQIKNNGWFLAHDLETYLQRLRQDKGSNDQMTTQMMDEILKNNVVKLPKRVPIPPN